jgi:hypothetical protein
MAGPIAAGTSAVVVADGEIVAATEGARYMLADAMVSLAVAVHILATGTAADSQADNLAT